MQMNILGKILTVDLSTRAVGIDSFPVEWAKKYLVGRGINSYLIFRDLDRGIDPFAPENCILFSGGLLTGTDVPASARLHVSGKSPLSGGLGSSNVGGGFGARFRSAGFHTVIVKGKAERPCFLLIENGKAEIRDASLLWGKDTWETQTLLKGGLGDPEIEVMVIGPAGENLVRFASIMTGRGHSAGRTGMGAVMGSKNLKAIVVRGRGKKIKTGGSAKEAIQRYHQKILKAPRYEMFSRLSNTFLISWANQMGILSTRNYRQGTFEGAERIDGRQMTDYVTKSKSCHRCPVHCKAEFRIDKGPFGGTVGERPDLEPIIALGSKCGVNDPEAILYLYNLCSKLGLDVLTTGSVLAFAMEAYEKGILTKEDTEEIDLAWGNYRSMEKMIHQIAERHGLGEVLSEGVRKAAEIIGKGAGSFAYHSKGLELTGYDPRGLMATALGYAVSTRGGDFTSVYPLPEFKWNPAKGKKEFGTEKACDRFSIEGKGPLVRRSILVSAVIDSLGICKVPALSLIGEFDLKNEAELTSRVTGWDVEAEDLFEVGERIINLENLFNIRHGLGDYRDSLPEMFQTRPLKAEAGEGSVVNIEPMLKEYYESMGWDSRGRPTEQKLKELGLDELAQEVFSNQ
jgi:aldehyde:ferredoxin oxidoreductase